MSQLPIQKTETDSTQCGDNVGCCCGTRCMPQFFHPLCGFGANCCNRCFMQLGVALTAGALARHVTFGFNQHVETSLAYGVQSLWATLRDCTTTRDDSERPYIGTNLVVFIMEIRMRWDVMPHSATISVSGDDINTTISWN